MTYRGFYIPFRYHANVPIYGMDPEQDHRGNLYYCDVYAEEDFKRTFRLHSMNIVHGREVDEISHRMCNCCSSMGMRLRKEQKEIDTFCEKNKLKYLLWDGDLMIKAPTSDWKIIINGRDKKMFLYHKNKFRSPSDDESMVPGYHSQAARQKTILGYLQYIVAHDNFRLKEAQTRERSRNSKRDLRRNTNHIQRGKTNRKYSANQLYSILDSLSL